VTEQLNFAAINIFNTNNQNTPERLLLDFYGELIIQNQIHIFIVLLLDINNLCPPLYEQKILSR
jgi:hypothetical protein